MIPVIEGSV